MKAKILFATLSLLLYDLTTQSQSYIPEAGNKKYKVQPAINIKAYAFNLRDVKLLPGSPFKHAMDMDAAYLLTLDPNRLLHRFYANAGLAVKAAVYGGWESEGLSGHTLGHYLSAISMMYVSTGNSEFKKRADYIVSELRRCQLARKSGYVGAIPKEDSIFGKVARGDIKTTGFDLNGGWSPWYTVHKVMAGLLDAYLYCDNAEALTVVTGMADWTNNTLEKLSPEQLQKMLKCEYGGMNDVLANLYAITGNKKYLDLSYKFYDDFVMEPLSKKIDPLPGKHSNTNVPKAIGSARQYELSGNDRDKTIASFFWDAMVHKHSYVIGGNSNYEYCGEESKLNDRLSDNTCETCNTYNMLKLTRHLFSWNPSYELMDFYERALYNHILASQNPETGMMCYFVPLRMGTQKMFSDSFNTFTCCVGSGMENHSKYAESIYSNGSDGSLYINLFIPSKVNWKAKGVTVIQQTNFPETNSIDLSVHGASPKELVIKIRKPFWARTEPEIRINKQKKSFVTDGSGYIGIKRVWKTTDHLEIIFPMDLYTEAMPDNPNRIAVKYGPLVLAGALGKQTPDPVYGTPVLLTNDRNAANWIHPAKEPLTFEMKNAGKPFDVTLIPFYKMYNQYYSVYWDFFTDKDWADRQAEYEAEKKRKSDIEKQTVDNFRIGEMQPERDHGLQASERSYVSDALGIMGREARADNYFSFDMMVAPGSGNTLLLTYIGDDKDRKFDIIIDGTLLHTEEWKGGKTGKFYDITYSIPNNLIEGKKKINVRIEAKYGKTAGRVFGCRILKQ